MTAQPTPPGERPLRADARRNRARVLEAAEQVLATDGPSVPIDDIARRAEVGAGTVYRHFPTKEALVEAVVSHRVQRLVEEAEGQLGSGDPGRAFFDFFSQVVEQALVNKALCDALESGSGFRMLEPAVAQGFREAMEGLLGNAQRAGKVRSDIDVTDVKALIVGSVTMQRQVDDDLRKRRLISVISDALK